MSPIEPGLFAVDPEPGDRVQVSTGAAAWAPDRPIDRHEPLAARMRPRNLDEVAGQAHLLGPGAPLRRLVQGGAPSSMLLYGPPGTGKTTLATLVAGSQRARDELGWVPEKNALADMIGDAWAFYRSHVA